MALDFDTFITKMPPKSHKKVPIFAKIEDKIAFEEKLIGLVQGKEHIWKLSSPEYKNKLKKQDSFKTIGETLKESGNFSHVVKYYGVYQIFSHSLQGKRLLEHYW